MGEAAAATAGGGNLESAGVVLAAIDQFSSNIQKYVEDLRRVQAANQKLTDEEQRAAAAATKTTGAWKLSGEQASKYGLAAGVLSGQMRQLGIQNEVAARGISIATEAMSGMLGPIGAVILAAGTLATAILAIANHSKEMKRATESVVEGLAFQAEKTGILNDAERQMLKDQRARILLNITEAETILAKAQAHEIELGWLEKVGVGLVAIGRGGEQALKTAQAWSDEKNAKATADQVKALRELYAQLEAINTAFAGGTDALEARARAEKDAADAAKKRGEEQERAEKWWENLRNSAYASELKIYEQARDVLQKRLKDYKDFYGKAKRLSDDYYQRIHDEIEAEKKAREEQFRHWNELAVQSAQIIGSAMGAAAAGSTSSWRTAAIAMIQLAVHAASTYLAIWGTAQAALGNWAGAARAAAGAAAIEALAAAGVAYLQERESRRHQGSRLNDGAPARRSGPSIGVDSGSTVANVSLTQNISGNVSPENAGDWRQQGQAFLDAHMDRWISRRRAQGYRFA